MGETHMTRAAVIAAYFKAHPDRWLDGRELATVGGAYAWRTRISDARRSGMTIENRVRRIGRVAISEYRYTPPVAVQVPLFGDAA